MVRNVSNLQLRNMKGYDYTSQAWAGRSPVWCKPRPRQSYSWNHPVCRVSPLVSLLIWKDSVPLKLLCRKSCDADISPSSSLSWKDCELEISCNEDGGMGTDLAGFMNGWLLEEKSSCEMNNSHAPNKMRNCSQLLAVYNNVFNNICRGRRN